MKLTTGVPLSDLNRIPDAVRSQRLEPATPIAISFVRSPMVFATTGWDLQRASGGRFVLSLGTQVKDRNERRFSVPWSAPAPRMRDLVRCMASKIWERSSTTCRKPASGLPGRRK